MNVKNIINIAIILALRGAFAAVGFTAPQLPESPYDDTEIAYGVSPQGSLP